VTTNGRQMLLATVSESIWQKQVIEWAHRAGWLVHHVHDSRKEEWGTDAGFPDLLLCRPPRVLAIELKSHSGRVSCKQAIWMAAFAACPGIESYTWRPTMEATVRRALGVQ
jgi:predicted type IV restriction endonuclease